MGIFLKLNKLVGDSNSAAILAGTKPEPKHKIAKKKRSVNKRKFKVHKQTLRVTELTEEASVQKVVKLNTGFKYMGLRKFIVTLLKGWRVTDHDTHIVVSAPNKKRARNRAEKYLKKSPRF